MNPAITEQSSLDNEETSESKFQLGAEVLENGALIVKTKQGVLFQRFVASRREHIEALRDACETALDELGEEDKAMDFSEEDLMLNSSVFEGGSMSLDVQKTQMNTKFKIEDETQIYALADMASNAHTQSQD